MVLKMALQSRLYEFDKRKSKKKKKELKEVIHDKIEEGGNALNIVHVDEKGLKRHLEQRLHDYTVGNRKDWADDIKEREIESIKERMRNKGWDPVAVDHGGIP